MQALWDSIQAIQDEFFNFKLMFDNFDAVIAGFWFTLQLSIVAGALSLIWGLILAVLRQTPGRAGGLLRIPAIAYINALRGVPLLLVILIIFTSLGQLTSEGAVPEFIGIPTWGGRPDVFWYGVIAITLTYGAYMAEVYRAGIEAVPGGQMEAARSLGMSHMQAMRYVIVPQAVRKVIPPLLNDFIALMKDTALVSVIGLVEVVQAARDVQRESLNSSALMLAAILFLLVTIPLAMLLDRLIKRQQAQVSRGVTI
ncbi:MAG: amino acid ABC transporter permease [Thermoleophilia bacterium]|nr:amino acid ABC transporter permease [Thermoleophilia bacterium]